MDNNVEKKSFKDTLNLPTTDFSIRAEHKALEERLVALWAKNNLYKKVGEVGEAPFSLHIGPPYTNGHLHIGHALNMTLKDAVAKAERMAGKKVSLVPGWDCHGLPIELKVTAELGEKMATLSPMEFKKECRSYSQKWIDIQREEMKKLGFLTDFDDYYATMQPAYEAEIVRAFADFVDKGYIERKGKTVSWCASCQTVLATAEIEYKDRKDPSAYITFPLQKKDSQALTGTDFEVSLLIWTTTPWTIPLNRAVVVHPTAPYAVVKTGEASAVIVGAERVEALKALFGNQFELIKTIASADLKGMHVEHPLIDGFTVPVILDNSVLLADGTACVHSAPGCGPDDYVLGLKNKLEIFSPLSADGKYTAEIQLSELEGMPVADGQFWVLKKLAERGRLLFKNNITHSYPHCWRCRNGLIFRATDQWFCNLEHNNLSERALKVVQDIGFIPEWGKNRLEAFVSGRAEWCISRQRKWGVPIPALIKKDTLATFTNKKFIETVAAGVEREGVEYWDRVSIADLIAVGALTQEAFDSFAAGKPEDVYKEDDILDVWFDSGVSHYATMKNRIGLPVDLYLEGSDQHRGWFQSSLLTAVMLYDKAPMKTILTHGFVVDEDRHKMSKSVGNVVSPEEVANKYGTDVLRLWVASSDIERDIVISEKLLGTVAENYRKIRNTCRFMLANLYDFKVADCLPLDQLTFLDQIALVVLDEKAAEIKEAYKQYKFTTVVQLLNNYCTGALSAGYLDMAKDRLYVERGQSRLSAQTALYYILDTLTKLMAPLLSFVAEEIYSFYSQDSSSIHLAQFNQPLGMLKVLEKSRGITPKMMDSVRDDLDELRSGVMKSLEEKRTAGLIKHSLEASVVVSSPFFEKIASFFGKEESLESFFKQYWIVSQVSINKNNDVTITADVAQGVKCPRCWQWDTSHDSDGLCQRCQGVLK